MQSTSRLQLFLKLVALIAVTYLLFAVSEVLYRVVLFQGTANLLLIPLDVAGYFIKAFNYLLAPVWLIPAALIVILTIASKATRKIVLVIVPILIVIMLLLSWYRLNRSCDDTSYLCLITLQHNVIYTSLYLIVSSACLYLIYLLRSPDNLIKFTIKNVIVYLIVVLALSTIWNAISLSYEVNQYNKEQERDVFRQGIKPEYMTYIPTYFPPGIEQQPMQLPQNLNTNATYRCNSGEFDTFGISQESIRTAIFVSVADRERSLQESEVRQENSSHYPHSTWQKVSVHGKPALYIESEMPSKDSLYKELVFFDDDSAITLSLSPRCVLPNPKDELIKIAESLQPTGKTARSYK